jgi:hypothetical protein
MSNHLALSSNPYYKDLYNEHNLNAEQKKESLMAVQKMEKLRLANSGRWEQ